MALSRLTVQCGSGRLANIFLSLWEMRLFQGRLVLRPNHSIAEKRQQSEAVGLEHPRQKNCQGVCKTLSSPNAPAGTRGEQIY